MGAISVAAFDPGDVLFTLQPQAEFFTRWEQRLCITPRSLHRGLWHAPDIEEANVGIISAEEYCQRCAVRLSINAEMVLAPLRTLFQASDSTMNL